MISLDATELDRWTDVLIAAGTDVEQGAEPVVAKGSLNIKTDARRMAPRGPHTPHYRESISYDLASGEGWVEGEIGPVAGRRQRGLGNLLEYGSPNNPPHPHLEPALDLEEPRFVAAAQTLGERPFR